MTRRELIEEHSNLFWHIPEDKKQEISDALLVETIMNYGTLDDYRQLVEVLTPERVAEVFFQWFWHLMHIEKCGLVACQSSVKRRNSRKADTIVSCILNQRGGFVTHYYI